MTIPALLVPKVDPRTKVPTAGPPTPEERAIGERVVAACREMVKEDARRRATGQTPAYCKEGTLGQETREAFGRVGVHKSSHEGAYKCNVAPVEAELRAGVIRTRAEAATPTVRGTLQSDRFELVGKVEGGVKTRLEDATPGDRIVMRHRLAKDDYVYHTGIVTKVEPDSVRTCDANSSRGMVEADRPLGRDVDMFILRRVRP